MKISTKGRYGLRALVELASHLRTEAVPLADVAKSQKISLNYLEQIFAELRRAGIVKSQKGTQGGYMLARKAEEIKVGDVLTALEGEFSIVDEVTDREEMAQTHSAIWDPGWDRINQAITAFLNERTLAELVDEKEEMNGTGEWIYYI